MTLSPQEENTLNEYRKQALALLEWAMDDISPADHKLRIECGVERELQCINPELALTRDRSHIVAENVDGNFDKGMDALRDRIYDGLSKAARKLLEILYLDGAGTYLLEFSTQPSSLLKTAGNVEFMTAHILEVAKGLGCLCDTHIDLPRTLDDPKWFNYYDQEVFPVSAEGTDHTISRLVGRGQHANVSVWLGDKNLFADNVVFYKNCADCGASFLPGMIMPSRCGNYHRINAGSSNSIQHIHASVAEKGSGDTIRIITSQSTKDEDAYVPKDSPFYGPRRMRLEFRQAAAEANPDDVVLAASLPLVKASIETLARDEKGKATEASNTIEYAEPEMVPMPKNEAEAAAMFNTKDNPYFIFLDRLAASKLKKLKEMQTEGEVNHVLEEQIRQATSLQAIGTKMHQLYCTQYGLESVMTLPVTQRAVV